MEGSSTVGIIGKSGAIIGVKRASDVELATYALVNVGIDGDGRAIRHIIQRHGASLPIDYW